VISDALNSAVTGLTVNAQRVAVAAENITNVSTRGYQPKQVETQSLSTGGAQVVSRPLDTPNIDPSAFSGTDLGQEFSNLILAESAYSASLKVIETTQDLSRNLLDELA
jgi:flagellar hook-associated protein FlgK